MNFSVGLILLGVLIILMLFGVFNRLFERMHMSTLWTVIGALAVGICFFIPSIRFGASGFRLNVGGGILASMIALYFLFSLGTGARMWRADLAWAAATGISLLMLTVIPVPNVGMQILFALVSGLLVGAVSYLIAGSYKGAMFASIAGMLSGQLLRFFINLGLRGDTAVHYGGGAIFDALIVAVVFTVVTAELVRMGLDNRSRRENRTAYSQESGRFFDEDDDFLDQ
ncbi:MAG: hypothetical protein LBM78_00310 [Clostridiales bacterium]|jgi:hypothetical protein|nr:hypothetical protein [Clostridiales bacterium]